MTKFIYLFSVLIAASTFFYCKKKEPQLPLITTLNPSNITPTTAQCGGVLYAEGDEPVTERGVCWSTSTEPTIDDPHTSAGTGTGTFTVTITGLSSNAYYARAYAKTASGVEYGRAMRFFVAFGSMTDIDGNTYKTVKIGGQVWMAENLRVTRFRNGKAIPFVTLQNSSYNNYKSAYCYIDDKPSNAKQYGCLYNAFAVFDTSNIAPPGWHVPTLNDFTIFMNTIGASTAAIKLKKKEGGYWGSDEADNSLGFDAIPCGYRYLAYEQKQNAVYWWMSNLHPSYAGDVTYFFSLQRNYNYLMYDGADNRISHSIRLIKDKP